MIWEVRGIFLTKKFYQGKLLKTGEERNTRGTKLKTEKVRIRKRPNFFLSHVADCGLQVF